MAAQDGCATNNDRAWWPCVRPIAEEPGRRPQFPPQSHFAGGDTDRSTTLAISLLIVN
jgi:hypothetical protein